MFTPRGYQLPVLCALDSGKKRACVIWHRRSGKDKTCINLFAKKMIEKKGNYYYFFPTYSQGKKIFWEGIGSDGFSFLDHFPDELFQKNHSELKITAYNGSTLRIVGTDNYNTIVGPNPVGCVFSEFALQDPRAWDYVRPILAENEGWAVFEYTPRGANHGKAMYEMAVNNPDWFVQVLTVNDTKRDDGSPVITAAAIQAERDAGMDEETIQQEFYCSFSGAMSGSYYGKLIKSAEDDAPSRIANVPHESLAVVHTWWDLGISDSTVIWFTQHIGKEIRVIDYYEAHGEGLAHYAKVLQGKNYVYGTHNAPHDIEVREMGTGKSRKEVAEALGISFQRVPMLSIADGISAVRSILPKCWFDKTKCKVGIEALKNYRREYDDKKKIFKDNPLHDWASHPADGFRMLGVGYQQEVKAEHYVSPFGQLEQGWMGQ
jgi:phage terminase large subunit